MTFMLQTALGRHVALDDRRGLQGDRILKLLHDHYLSPFNADKVPMKMELLTHATGLDFVGNSEVVNSLVGDGLVELHGFGQVRISPKGLELVQRACG